MLRTHHIIMPSSISISRDSTLRQICLTGTLTLIMRQRLLRQRNLLPALSSLLISGRMCLVRCTSLRSILQAQLSTLLQLMQMTSFLILTETRITTTASRSVRPSRSFASVSVQRERRFMPASTPDSLTLMTVLQEVCISRRASLYS